MDGRVLGTHAGITDYTIGQRRGLNVAVGEPLFVTKLDPASARVIVGPREALLTASLTLDETNWLGDEASIEAAADAGAPVLARVRSTRPPSPARLSRDRRRGLGRAFDDRRRRRRPRPGLRPLRPGRSRPAAGRRLHPDDDRRCLSLPTMRWPLAVRTACRPRFRYLRRRLSARSLGRSDLDRDRRLLAADARRLPRPSRPHGRSGRRWRADGDLIALHRQLIPALHGFLQHLDGHHSIESGHYFPQFRAIEPRIAAGIDLLDRDHDAVHETLEALFRDGMAFHRAVAGKAPDAADHAARLADRIAGAARPSCATSTTRRTSSSP